jgi:hypothetical protein
MTPGKSHPQQGRPARQHQAGGERAKQGDERAGVKVTQRGEKDVTLSAAFVPNNSAVAADSGIGDDVFRSLRDQDAL